MNSVAYLLLAVSIANSGFVETLKFPEDMTASLMRGSDPPSSRSRGTTA
jgi:hypothetical protein